MSWGRELLSNLERIRIHYDLEVGPGTDVRERADAIAREQTVELPRGTYPARFDDSIVGRIDSVVSEGSDRARVIISYDPFVAGDDLPQLLNLIFGNVSMLTDVRIADVELPDEFAGRFQGPGMGLAGLRNLVGVGDRPIIVGTIKPMGLSSGELASLCATMAAAGVDIVKDDHGLTNQPSAPFDERVAQCHEAAMAANEKHGGNTLYFPNVSAEPREMDRRVAMASSIGCAGVLVSPMLTGLASMKPIAETGMAVLAHPSGTGGVLRGGGLSPEFLYGVLLRLAGADGVIYTNAGGRFPFTETQCEAINRRARAPLGPILSALPIAGGGIDADRVDYWIARYGIDVGLLIGSSLYAKPELGMAARELMESVIRACQGRGTDVS